MAWVFRNWYRIFGRAIEHHAQLAPADFFNYLVSASLVYDESIWLKSFTRISKLDLPLIFEKYITATTHERQLTVFCLFKVQKKPAAPTSLAIDVQSLWMSIAQKRQVEYFF